LQDRVIKYFKINTKWFALVTSSLVFITILFLQCWFLNSQKNEYNEVVNQFVENVMTGQAEKAMNLSTGIVRFNLNNAGQNNAGQGLTYKIKDIKTKTLVSKAGFCTKKEPCLGSKLSVYKFKFSASNFLNTSCALSEFILGSSSAWLASFTCIAADLQAKLTAPCKSTSEPVTA
jgi:hypothetical protein